MLLVLVVLQNSPSFAIFPITLEPHHTHCKSLSGGDNAAIKNDGIPGQICVIGQNWSDHVIFSSSGTNPAILLGHLAHK